MTTLEYSEERTRLKIRKRCNAHRCLSCRFKTTSLFFILNHARRHESRLQTSTCEKGAIEKFQCTDCNFTTDLTIIFKQHIQEHHVNRVVFDPRVGVTTRTYLCKLCSFGTHFRLKWLEHMLKCHPSVKDGVPIKRTKRSNRWFLCDQCEARIRSNEMLQNHKKRKHMKDDEIEWFQCGQCVFRAKTKGDLEMHVFQRHEDKRRFQCDQCDYRAKLKCALKAHKVNRHAENCPVVKCELCDYRTKAGSAMYLHKRQAHLKDQKMRSFECHHCGYQAKLKSLLLTHIKFTHSSVRSYKCDQCDYKAKRNWQVTLHKTKHLKDEEIEWIPCDQCEFKAKHKRSLRTHTALKHANGTFACDKCPFTTKSKIYLKKHDRYKHAKESEGLNVMTAITKRE